MKKIIDGIKFGIGFVGVILFFFILGFFIVSARTSNYGSLESQTGDKITSTKFNQLVARTSRVDISISDTNPFDPNCERRYQGLSSPAGATYWFYSFQINQNGNSLYNYAGNYSRIISKNSKGTIASADSQTRTTTKIQKKCQ